MLWWAACLAGASLIVFFAVFCFACTVMIIRHVIEEFKLSKTNNDENGVSVLPDERPSTDGLLSSL